MSAFVVFLAVLALGLIGWFVARAKARLLFTGRGSMHSLPGHHGIHMALWVIVPALFAWAVWGMVSPGLVRADFMANPVFASLPTAVMDRDSIISEAIELAKDPNAPAFQPDATKLIPAIMASQSKFALIGLIIVAIFAFVGGAFGYTRIKAAFPARTQIERAILAGLMIASLIAVLTTFGIIASLVFESALFFQHVDPLSFVFGTRWAPDTVAPVTDDFNGSLGALPLFWGTLFIGAIIAMIVAIPFGLLSAIYLTQYASHELRKWVKPLIEILAGIPTVV